MPPVTLPPVSRTRVQYVVTPLERGTIRLERVFLRFGSRLGLWTTDVALPAADVHRLLLDVPGWTLAPHGDRIRREWRARDFAAALAFFNRIGEIADREDHHPDLSVHFNHCVVRLNTHDVQGISATDFDCASRFDALLA